MSLSVLSQTQIIISDTLTCFTSPEGRIVLSEIYKGYEAKELLTICEEQVNVLRNQLSTANNMLINRNKVINIQDTTINKQSIGIAKLQDEVINKKKRIKFWRNFTFLLLPISIAETYFIINGKKAN